MSKTGRTWKSPFAILLVVFSVVFVGSTVTMRALTRRHAVGQAPRVIENWAEHARTGHASGSTTPSVTVLVFADYQCAGCASFHAMLVAAQHEMPADLRVVKRHFPLSVHAHAAAAANAAECAAEQGRFDEMETLLYAQQDSIARTPWSRFAIRAGVRDTVRFSECVKTMKFEPVVERDRQLAKILALDGTPTYLINGVVHFGATTPAVFLQQLRDAGSLARTAQLNLARGNAGTAAAAPPVRKWLDTLTIERTIAGAADDELLIPGGLTSTVRGELIVFDYGAMEIRSFARDGKQLWREGRSGAGPGEYRNMMDVEARSNGELALLDMGNRRITTLSASGKLRRTIPLELNASRFIATADTSNFTLAGDDSTTLWVNVGQDGKVARRMSAPSSLSARNGLAREPFTAALGDRSVVAYRWSDRILVLAADGSVQAIIDGIEPITMPNVKEYPATFGKFRGTVARIDPKAIPASLSVATDGKQIYVLFAGRTAERGRIIDMYDANSHEYLGSHLLPMVAQEIAVLPDGAIAALRMDPVPAMDILRASAPKRIVLSVSTNSASGPSK